MDGCEQELRADFQQYYGIDLCELLDGFEFERADVLARQLPAGSRTVSKLVPQSRWGDEEHLLALIADNLSYLRYEQSGGRGRRPKPVPRPSGARAESAPRVASADVERMLFDKR